MYKYLALFLFPLLALGQFTPPAGGSSATVTVDPGTSALKFPSDFFTVNAPLIPSTAPIIDVADNTAKLALTGLSAGQRVRITGEGNRIEMYLGESEEFTGSVVVSGAGTAAANGTYAPDGTANGKTSYQKTGGGSGDDIIFDDGEWVINVGGEITYLAADDVATPDLVTTWTTDAGIAPVPTVAAETATLGPEAAVNWVTLYEGGRRLPMFEIQVPSASGFTDFELKASVTNFTGATAADRFAYIYHSPDPDLAEADYETKPLVWFTRSGTDTIVHRQQPAAASIHSVTVQLDADSEVGSIFVIVRGPEVWKWEDNPDVLWAFVFFDSLGPEEDGATPARQIWRAIRPVKWITEDKIPSFLNQ